MGEADTREAAKTDLEKANRELKKIKVIVTRENNAHKKIVTELRQNQQRVEMKMRRWVRRISS